MSWEILLAIVSGLFAGGFLGFFSAAKAFSISDCPTAKDDEETSALPEAKPPPWTGMDLATWRERPHLIDFAIGLYATPEWHRMMEVLWTNQPVASLSKDTDYAAQLGRAQGYREALAVLAELAKTPPVAPTEPKLDYSGDPLGQPDEETT